MKNSICILFLFICGTTYSQSFLNGDFENNTASVDQTNMTNATFNAFMSNSVAFGNSFGGGPSGGNMDIITSSTYCGSPQNGNWFVALTSGGTDAISLELSSALVAGNCYTISFYDRSCSPYPAGSPIQIGVSNVNNNFGSLVYTAPTPIYNGGWTHRTFSFIAPINGIYITITCAGSNNVNNWTQVDNFSIDDSYSINLNLGNDTTLCQGETLVLDATNVNATYLWHDNSSSPTYNVSQQGTYWVQITVNNCSTTDTILIDQEECEVIFEIPNVFTPNNDGVNDFFVPVISRGIVSMNTMIYNRWGNKIYETNNLYIEWNGQDVSDGTYFWIVYYTDKNGFENSLKGFVTILK